MTKIHLFRKKKPLKSGKFSSKWYYYYLDGNKKQVQKACRGCKTRAEAEDYVRSLPESKPAEMQATVKDIARDMYVPGGGHVRRREQLGRATTIRTLSECRIYLEKIISEWGDRPVASLDETEITSYLFGVEKSSSWKNRYMNVFKEIFLEAPWHGCKAGVPLFRRFARQSKKADVFTTEELGRLFVEGNFSSETLFLLFLLCLSAGLRLGEARAVRPKQFLPERRALVVDGFCLRDGTRTDYNKGGTSDAPKFRVAALPEFAIQKLSDFISRRGIGQGDFCFSYNGKPISHQCAERAFANALKKAGIERGEGRRLTPHSLRFTYVTRMRRELPAETVRKMVGHASLGMTDYYTARAALDESLAGISGADAAANNLFL